MANSLGLYRTLVTENGSVKYYFHDAATLADSTVIYTLTAGGFATTDDWNDGNPTWHYGMSRDGNAVVNALSAYKITSDLIDTGAVTADKIATEVLSQYVTNGQLTTALSASEAGILATVSSTYATQSTVNGLNTRMSAAELKITDSAIISTVTNTTAGQNAVNSLIEQKADSIRLQASTIAWDSQYSSMTANGKLECQEATVNGSLYSGESNGYYVNINDGIISGGKTNVIGYDNFISFQGVFGYGDGPYLKGDNITFEGDIKVIDSYTIYTGYSGAVKIPTSIRSDGTVATWLNISFINGLLVQ